MNEGKSLKKRKRKERNLQTKGKGNQEKRVKWMKKGKKNK